MENTYIESQYPINFRQQDAQKLGAHLRHRHSVELIGMRRVGISNFLRFFLYHENIVEKYINHQEKHLFIPVDLNDLIEREIFPFWRLTFKRIVDAVERFPLSIINKKRISSLFVSSIQSDDLFLTVDAVRQSVMEIVKFGILPTIFFIRFDRLKDAVTLEFFNNLQGLKEATGHKLSFVFTSFRSLDQLSPSVFKRQFLSVFSHPQYIKPAEEKDIKIIFKTFIDKYKLSLDKKISKQIFDLSGGYVQYLQLSLIILYEKIKNQKLPKNHLIEKIIQDERINLQSEELYENLTADEQTMLKKIIHKQKLDKSDRIKASYLWDSGFIINENSIFSPLFLNYLIKKENSKQNGLELSKKENDLFEFLQKNKNQICEREKIIENVWPEYSEIGVSDWAIDRLIARLRNKLKRQNSPYQVITVRTRGYKLIQ